MMPTQYSGVKSTLEASAEGRMKPDVRMKKKRQKIAKKMLKNY